MLDAIRKSLLLSLGTAVIAKEKVDEAIKKLVEQGKISREEAEKLSQDFQESGERQWTDIQALVRDTVRKALDSLDIPSAKEFEELKKRVENLEKRVSLASPPLTPPEQG